jgi:hypothetical protein
MMPTDQKEMEKRRDELKTLAEGFEQTAKTHQNEQERIEKQHGWGEFAAPTTPAAAGQTPQGAQPAQGAQQPAAKAAKTATLANVRAYAAKNGISEAEAVRRVKAEGYTVGQ